MADVDCSSSYLSQNEHTLHFGLGTADQIEILKIVWPDGMEEIHRDIAVDQEIKFEHHAKYPVYVMTPVRPNETTTRQIKREISTQ